MAKADHLYEDQWGACIDRPDDGYIEIRWYDSTEAFTKDEFNEWLTGFADVVLARHRAAILVDATAFKMDPSFMDMEWRDANIVPRYHEAGLTKFAFQMPAGMPLIGSQPAPEGVANYPTGYFGTRRDALDWLAS